MIEQLGGSIPTRSATVKRRGVIAKAMAGHAERRPASARPITASRRSLLKGAGALVFTTALLATGEVVAVPSVRVGAADSRTRPMGTPTPAAVTADTRYLTFVGTDFQPENTTDGYIGVGSGYEFGAGQAYQSTGSPVGSSARVELPQGATITEVLFYVIHNDANSMFVNMAGYDSLGNVIGIGAASPPSSNSFVQTITPSALTNTTVDNGTYSYVLEWLPGTVGTTHQLYGARVGYRLPGLAQLYGSAQAGIGASGLSATGTGILGQADAAGATGVKGVSASGFPIIGNVTGAANTAAGVLGSGTKGPGMQGQSTSGHGLVGTTNDTGGHAGLIGNATHTGGIGLMGIAPNYGTMTVGHAGEFYGNVKIFGGSLVAPVVQASVKHPTDGSYRAVYSLTTPEGWVEDFGSGTFAADTAHIMLDAEFAALIQSDYHVFLTARGPLHLYVDGQDAAGFTVIATPIGSAGGPKPAVGGGSFSWRVVGKRKDVSGERLAKVAAPSAPKIPAAFTIPETPEIKAPTTQP